MKKSQIVVFILTIALVFAVAVLPDLLVSNTTDANTGTGGSVTWTVGNDVTDPDPADEPGSGPVTTTPGDTTDIEVDPTTVSPEPETPAPSTPTEPEMPGTQTQTYDLGPDIELDEGITDARLEQAIAAEGVTVEKGGSYTSKVEVALYIHKYGRVPDNYISKTKARNAGWINTEGNLWDVLPGKSIGGGGYYNEGWGDEPILPETPEGRDWRECDINYQGGYRGPERLVYSDDGLVFYTGDHYESFERLY
ncbi:MAG: ribonuclease domain-containing protein [Coriobacteriales bacterium]|nr:ribonuclease domain-containing protein [Coriobacteriales bacterium]MDO5708727.1 ribonuclease domain-containing protein [Coriobacteriales bacterium]